MTQPFSVLLVFVGGGFGAVMRYASTQIIGRWMGGGTFPWHTLGVNLVGAFLIGLLAELLALRFSLAAPLRLLLVTGFLGGYTTFSAFSLEGALMLERGDYFTLALYVFLSVAGCLAAVFLGGGLIKALP